MESQQHGDQLKRGLRNRHIQLIALSGAIDTRLFPGSVSVIQSVGPNIILGYAIAGFITFLIMRQLGEVVIEEPVAGSFSHFAYKHWSDSAGLFSDWNYWVLYVLVAMARLAAVGKYIRFWYPEIPAWVSATVFFVSINTINLTDVKVFGKTEFWFAIIRVITVVATILFGNWLLSNGNSDPRASVSNLWDQGGFLPHGSAGLVIMMAIIMFSFGGLELVGTTAVEADSPEQGIPKATNRITYRILISYVGSLAVLLSLIPWVRATADISPFVLIFRELGDTSVANALNIVVLTTALFVYNSCVYCSSHMLSGLTQQGNAPEALTNVDKRDVPVDAILVSVLVTVLCVLINYLTPESAFSLLMALVVFTLVISWVVISLAYMKFRKAKQQQGVTTRLLALLYPLGNWICLAFTAAVLVIMLTTPGMAISVYLIPVWIAILDIGYLCKRKTAGAVKVH